MTTRERYLKTKRINLNLKEDDIIKDFEDKVK